MTARAAATVRTLTLTLRGQVRRVGVAGEGPPLLALHGFTGSLHSFDRVLTRLAAQRTVLVPEALGHGGSAVPADAARLSLAQQAADLAALLDTCGIDRTDLLGYSMGGRMALAFAAEHPDRVRRLVLESASPGIADPAARSDRMAADASLADLLDRQGLEPFLAVWESLPLLRPASPLPRVWAARQRRERRAHTAHGLAQSLRGAGTGSQAPLHDALPRLPMPVLCLAGEADRRYADLAGWMAGQTPLGRCAILAGTGHTAHLEAPGPFLEAVLPFLADGPPPGPPPTTHPEPGSESEGRIST